MINRGTLYLILLVASVNAQCGPVSECSGNGGACTCGADDSGQMITMNRFWGDNNDEKVWGCGGAFVLSGASWKLQWEEGVPEAGFEIGFSQTASKQGWEGCCAVCGINLQMAGKISDGWYCEKDALSTGIWLKGRNK